MMRIKGLKFLIACGLVLAVPFMAHANQEDIATSDKTFMEAVEAAKAGDYDQAFKLFELQAEAAQHDAQFNLALMLKTGRGTPQHYADALKWAWLSHLGGIEKGKPLADEILDVLPEATVEEVRQDIAANLKARIDAGDKPAVMQYARHFVEILAEEDYEQAYLWYSIAAAIGSEGGQEARDLVAENLDTEVMITLQDEARTTFYGLSFGK
jgi:TPR repeat protein